MPYMDGRGVRSETNRLINNLWAELDNALLGGFVGALALTVGLFVGIVAQKPILGAVIASTGAGAWYFGSKGWRKAQNALRQHRLNMRAETERLGEGWAKS